MSPRRRNHGSLRNWWAEHLESRAMLAGHGFGPMFNAANFGAFSADERPGLFAGAAFGAQTAARDFLFRRLGGDDYNQGTVLSANLTDADTGETARVVFKSYTSEDDDGTTETELKVTVTGAAADSTLDVTVGDVVVGQITTDASGNGKLILSSDPEDDEAPLPDGFPADVAAGTAVSVGSLSGTLAGGLSNGGGCHGENGASLRARLADEATGASATVHLRTHTNDEDVTTTKLVVKVTGAAPETSLDVTIGDVVVGQVTTDTDGAGRAVFSSNPTSDQLPLPENFPTDVAAGTVVSVGTMTGELELGHGGHHDRWHR